MEVAETIQSVRKLVKKARSEGKKIGLVPTMGALHIGHISLIKRAMEECDFVVISIFVNPTQFGPAEDFDRYPRNLDADLKICKKAGVDVVFAPSVEQMYAEPNLTWVNVEELTDPLCGRSRPGHFRGVTTVCAKLFNIVGADVAYFGQKDAQQSLVIKRMVADLNIPLEIVICPTVREPDGLAVSSRNQYLTSEQRKDAACIYKALQKCRQMIDAGVEDAQEIINQMHKAINQVSSIEIEYVSIVDAETLQAVEHITGTILVAIAAKIGTVRLIDNILLDLSK
jgi:pantoate--beta-alanine ligase